MPNVKEAVTGALLKLTGRSAGKGWALGRRVVNKGDDPEYFHYTIYKDGKPIGYANGRAEGNKARIDWFGNDGYYEDAGNIPVGVTRGIREVFRKDFPKVNVFEGKRISGAKERAEYRYLKSRREDDAYRPPSTTQSIKIPAAAAGGFALADMLNSEDAEAGMKPFYKGMSRAARPTSTFGKWGLSDNIGKGDSNEFSYIIHHDGEPVGEIAGRVVPGGKEKGKTAFISWVGPPNRQFMESAEGRLVGDDEARALAETSQAMKIPKIGLGAIKMFRERFRHDYPEVDTFEGSRLSGMYEGRLQSVKVREAGGGLAAALYAGGLSHDDSDLDGDVKKVAGIKLSPNISKIPGRFKYQLTKEGVKEPVGMVQGLIDSKKDAFVTWVGPDETKGYGGTTDLGYQGVREIMRTLKKDFPEAENWHGMRISGAKARMKDPTQRTKLREVGSGSIMGALAMQGHEFEDDRPDPPPPEPPTTAKDIAAVPLDLMSYAMTGMRAGEAVDTGKQALQAVADLGKPPEGDTPVAGKETQVARAIQPGEPPPEDAVSMEPPPDAEVVGEAQPPQGFWGKVGGRFMGTDVPDENPMERGTDIVGGSLVGLSAGLKVPGPPIVKAGAAAIGSAGGAAIGALGPETRMKVWETLGILPEGYTEEHGLSARDLKTVMEGEALIDAGTGGGLTALRGISRGVSKIFTGGGKQGRALAEDAIREGVALMPVQVGERRIGRGYVGTLGRFPLFAGLFRYPLKQGGAQSAKQLRDAYTQLPERIAPIGSMSETNLKVLKEIEGTVTKVNEGFSQRMDTLLDTPGITVGLRNTVRTGMDFVDNISNLIPKAGPVSGGKAPKVQVDGWIKNLQDFANKTLIPLAREGVPADQSLRQADTLLTSVDKKIAEFGKQGNTQAVKLLEGLRQGIQTDMITGLKGPRAAEVGADLKTLQADWNTAVSELMNNGIARHVGLKPGEGTRAAILTGARENISDTIGFMIRSQDPAMVDDMARVLSPKAFKDMTSAVLADRVGQAIKRGDKGEMQFNPGKFATSLGLDHPGSDLYKQTEALLRHSGGLTMKELHRFDDIAKAVEGVDIPDISTFIARRGVMGGISGVVKGMVPTLAIASGAAGGSAVGGSVGLSNIFGAGIVTILGNRVTHAIARPENARLLRKVLDNEVSEVVKYNAYQRLGRVAMDGLRSDNEISEKTREGLQTAWDAFGHEVAKYRAKGKSNANQSQPPEDTAPLEAPGGQ